MQDLNRQAPHGKEGATTGSAVHSSLPTFIVIGAMQAGTTTLHAWLAEHPDEYMSARKELDCFLEEGNWDRAVGWYRLRFGFWGAERARGENSLNHSKTHLDPVYRSECMR